MGPCCLYAGLWKRCPHPPVSRERRPPAFADLNEAQAVRQMACNDPFLTNVQADYKTASPVAWTRREHLVTREVGLLIFVPWFCYVLLLVTFALPPPGIFWNILAFLAWSLVCLGAGTSYDLQRRQGTPIYKLLTITVLISCLAGPLVGHHIFVTEMSGYWMHKSGVTYKDVVPSKHADAFQDAGIIDFAASAQLDLRKSFGVRAFGETETYCVAPVVDAAQPGAVSFFAAGVDCCEPRRSFLCGDALKPSARTGVVLPSSASSYNAARWDRFHDAATRAAKVHGWQLPERPIFLRWFEDAEAVQSELAHRGLVEAFIQSFAGLCASTVMAMWLHWSLTYYAREGEAKAEARRSVTGC
ncbi:unnamed protein product [Effrenium voratum]|nr:unnamed protein product [Effrenium voratum]